MFGNGGKPDQKGAKEARDYVRALTQSEEVTISFLGKGKYGRALAEVWIGDVNLTEVLLEKGYAVRFGEERKKGFKEFELYEPIEGLGYPLKKKNIKRAKTE